MKERAPPDGGLRKTFKAKIPSWQWTTIESPIVGGVPDAEYCSTTGRTGWVEFKKTTAWAVRFQPLQIPWITRRAKLGGRVFVAIRRTSERHGVDELYLVPGRVVFQLASGGLNTLLPGDFHGPWSFDDVPWKTVEEILSR